eukprot:12918313-Alexandrium_andersonii.AAC.1
MAPARPMEPVDLTSPAGAAASGLATPVGTAAPVTPVGPRVPRSPRSPGDLNTPELRGRLRAAAGTEDAAEAHRNRE